MKRLAFTAIVLAPLLVAVACSDEFTTNTLPPSSDGGTECKPNIASIQSTVFARRCTNIGCHTAKDPASALDLESPGVEARLNNVEAADCPGEVLVLPGKADTSFLVRKLEDEKPACGMRMPRSEKGIPASEIACIKTWISGLTNTGPLPDASAPDVAVNCKLGESVCGGVCVDRQTDPKNCGECGNACPADKKFCAGGQCLAACPGGTTSCSNACIDTTSDTRHCGGCGNACSIGQVCSGSACACGTDVAYKAQIEDAIIVPLCATSQCHGRTTAPAGGLDLRAGTAYGALVGKNSGAPACSSRTFVVPNDVAASYLVAKLRGTPGICGSPMPKSGGLAPSQLALVEAWICNGAAND
jgi:hypothetical protein